MEGLVAIFVGSIKRSHDPRLRYATLVTATQRVLTQVDLGSNESYRQYSENFTLSPLQ